MKYSYEQIPKCCWYNAIPYLYQYRDESDSAKESPIDAAGNCIKIGDPAPEFCLEGVLAGERTRINLKEYRGRWTVVFFYPSDFTFV